MTDTVQDIKDLDKLLHEGFVCNVISPITFEYNGSDVVSGLTLTLINEDQVTKQFTVLAETFFSDFAYLELKPVLSQDKQNLSE